MYTRWMVITGLLLAFVVGGATIFVTDGRVLDRPKKQLVLRQVENGWTISECSTAEGEPCTVSKVATTNVQAYAVIWTYISGRPIQIDWGK